MTVCDSELSLERWFIYLKNKFVRANYPLYNKILIKRVLYKKIIQILINDHMWDQIICNMHINMGRVGCSKWAELAPGMGRVG